MKPSLLVVPALLATGSALLLSCGGNDTGGLPAATPPDVSGPYQVIVGGTTGCEGESGWINDWATGPLTISGTGGALSFDFGTGTVFDGSIDSLGRYQFSGTIDFNNAVLDVSNEGSFALDPDYDGERWLMDGDFSVVVDDDEFTTNNCTITGPVKATELVGI